MLIFLTSFPHLIIFIGIEFCSIFISFFKKLACAIGKLHSTVCFFFSQRNFMEVWEIWCQSLKQKKIDSFKQCLWVHLHKYSVPMDLKMWTYKASWPQRSGLSTISNISSTYKNCVKSIRRYMPVHDLDSNLSVLETISQGHANTFNLHVHILSIWR